MILVSEIKLGELMNQESDLLSAQQEQPLEVPSESQLYNHNLSSNQKQAQNRANFKTLGKIREQEKIEIFKTGFRFNQEGKISLKKYYESTDPDSLFQLYRVQELNTRVLGEQNFINS